MKFLPTCTEIVVTAHDPDERISSCASMNGSAVISMLNRGQDCMRVLHAAFNTEKTVQDDLVVTCSSGSNGETGLRLQGKLR